MHEVHLIASTHDLHGLRHWVQISVEFILARYVEEGQTNVQEEDDGTRYPETQLRHEVLLAAHCLQGYMHSSHSPTPFICRA